MAKFWLEGCKVGDLAKVRLLYFLQCACGCCIGNFIQLFFRGKGLSVTEIGLLCGAVSPFISMFGNPLWAYVADRTRRPKLVMMAALVGGACITFSMQFLDGFRNIALLYGAGALVSSAVNPLLDSSTMTVIKDNGIPLTHYGRFRVFGAVGWGITAPVVGVMIDRFGQSVMFLNFAALAALYILTMALFPVRTDASAPRDSRENILRNDNDESAFLNAGCIKKEEGQANALLSECDSNEDAEEIEEASQSAKLSFCAYLRALLSGNGVPLFLLLVLAMGVCKGVIDVYLFLHLDDLGATSMLMGITLLVTTVSEIPFFFFSGPIIQRVGAIGVVLFSLAMYDARLFYYSQLKSPWWVLPAELLHGITFALSWSTVASHAAVISPKGYTTTTQGVLSALFWGFGFGSGAMAGGFLNRLYGAPSLFFFTALFASGAVVLGGIVHLGCTLWRRRQSARNEVLIVQFEHDDAMLLLDSPTHFLNDACMIRSSAADPAIE